MDKPNACQFEFYPLHCPVWLPTGGNRDSCLPLTRQIFARSRTEGCDLHSGQMTGISFNGVNFIGKKTARQGLPGCRGSALLMLMSDAMLRVSKLAGVQAAFLEVHNGRFTVSASKTDQEGRNVLYFLDSTPRGCFRLR